MRTIQEIFNIIIEKGLYPYNDNVEHSTNYMCISADVAFRRGYISYDEYLLVKKDIKDYMGSTNSTLIEHLESLGISWKKDDCLEIYQNWTTRPCKLTGVGMEFNFTPVQTVLRSCFELQIEHEHGDADVSTNGTITLKDATRADLAKYISDFEAANEVIDKRRRYGVEIPDDFETTHGKSGKFYIPLEHDVMAEGVSNYYASMTITAMSYYNDFGTKFDVTIIPDA
jgi:hypothetical protein